MRRLGSLAIVVALLGGCGGPSPSPAPPSLPASSGAAAPSSPAAPALDPVAVGAAITETGLWADLAALEAAAKTSPTYRALGSPGYDASVALVEKALQDAGWAVHEDVFTAPAFTDDGRSTVQVGGTSYGAADVRPLVYGPAGEAEGPVVTIGWPATAPAPGGSGCEVADYGTLPPNAIVVVGRADCYRRQAVTSAQEAGAAAFVAVVPGPAGTPPLRPTLISTDGMTIPAVSVSMAAALALRDAAGAGGTARVTSTARTSDVATRSVIAELAGEQPGAVVLLGAHLDSVIDGPGLNDNGTGVAALLGFARALAGAHPQATIRLAFWAAEEEGLLGSVHYVSGLSTGDRDAIAAYLNADMVGSPNGYAGVYEEQGEPSGSASIRALLQTAVARLGAVPVAADTGGGSDHVPFARSGVPSSGVFSGASEQLTAEQAASFGGSEGQTADACYHTACDGSANVNLRLARLLAAVIADAAVRIAEDPALVVR